MTSMSWINVILWIIDLCVVIGLTGFYLWFAKWYHDWNVLEINSGHDIIDSQTLSQVIFEAQKRLKLTDYSLEFQDGDYEQRLFWNLRRRQKKIILTKRVFPSVGYELDYLLSRLWLSSKELQRNRLVLNYKLVVKYLPYIYLFLIVFCFFAQTVVFFLGISQQETIINPTVDFLWINPIFAFLVVIFFAIWMLNFYFAFELKLKIEILYNQEIIPSTKEFLGIYNFDFLAARRYAQELRIPYALTFKNRLDKWLGPFVY